MFVLRLLGTISLILAAQRKRILMYRISYSLSFLVFQVNQAKVIKSLNLAKIIMLVFEY